MKWIRVELHTHTIASDGDMLPNELVENSLVRKYKAIVVTDHNTTALCEETVNEGKKEGLLVIPGVEWTTFWGHIVVTGGNSDVDWRTITDTNIDEKIARAKELGDIVTIAHPMRLGTPFCSECRFLFNINNWENVGAYEVWSHYEPAMKKEAEYTKAAWGKLLNQGYRLAAVYGYDWHTPDENGPTFAYTYVGLEDDKITQESVLDAIKKGRTYISMGVELNGKLVNKNGEYYSGDEIKPGKYSLELEAKIASDYGKQFDCEIKGLRMYQNEKVIFAKKWDGKNLSMPVLLLAKGTFRVELYGSVDGENCDIAIISPFYIK